MDYRERLNNPVETQRVAIEGETTNIWTSMPGIVTKVNHAAMTVEVQPAIQGKIAQRDGSVVAATISVLPDVPIIFPSGGGYTLTFPIAVGDECMLHFSARCIDGWWQSGGVSAPLSSRRHDLSDATAHFGPKSQPRVIGNVSTTAAQFRSDDGKQLVEINNTTGLVRIVAGTQVDIVAPVINLVGSLRITQGTGVGVLASMDGELQVAGQVTAGFGTGNSVGLNTHVHPTTAPPVPGT